MQVDLCFLVDCTGSMKPWIIGIQTAVTRWASVLQASYPDCCLRFAFVGYTDYDERDKDRIKSFDFNV